MKKKKMFTLFLVFGLIMCGFSQTVSAEDDVVYFEDENLAEAVYSMLGKWEDVTKDDMLELTWLNDFGAEGKITNLSGLENATNLESIYFQNSKIEDYSPLSQLEVLNSITIQNDPTLNLTNLVEAIKELPALNAVDLSNNQLTNITPLSSLTNIERLALYNNDITDISGLSNLTKLNSVFLNQNKISDITPLTNLTNLESLNIADNSVNELNSLKGMSKLELLDVANNKITNIDSLLNLASLQVVNLEKNSLNLNEGSPAYQTIQVLLNNDVKLLHDDLVILRQKKVTSDSITVDWSVSEKHLTYGTGNYQIRLHLNGEIVKVFENLEVTEYTFTELESDKEYEIKIEFEFGFVERSHISSKSLVVKAQDIDVTEKVVAKPTVNGNNATITYELINSVQSGGQLELDLQDFQEDQLNVRLTAAQLQMLQDENISVVINRGDAALHLPVSVLGQGKDVTVSMDRLDSVEGALSAVYDFTISTEDGNISTFSVPVTLSFQVVESEVTSPDNVKVWYFNPTTEEWENIGGTYANGTVTATTDHFSTYTVFETESEDETSETVTDKEENVEEGNRLPETATNMMNFLLLGSLFVILAFALLIYQKRNERT